MRFEEPYFRRKSPDRERLERYGFRQDPEGSLYYSQLLKEETFRAEIRVSPSGEVCGRLVDLEFGDEFYQIHSENQRGAFVAEIAEEYGALLEEIARECFIPEPFISPQANRIARKVLEEFGERPDFPFSKIEGAGVFRNPDNRKWYGLIMEVDKNRLKKSKEPPERGKKGKSQPSRTSGKKGAAKMEAPPKEMIEAMNIKVRPERIDELTRMDGIYRCYHMSNKHWLTVALEDRVEDEFILELLRESRGFTLGKKPSGSRKKNADAGGTREDPAAPRKWLMPANVDRFDVPAALARDRVLLWKHGTRVKPGDLVYLYFSAPVSAIRYRFRVVESAIDYRFSDEKMNEREEKAMRMELLQEFDPPFPLSEMKKMGIGAVRGPRSIPEELEKEILRIAQDDSPPIQADRSSLDKGE